ncbi:hypothetical protein K7X08_014233 [Anisodus acutangulus]|uniref:Uncharacterized protein n=1 Tax=Anisodus acutangulus TaxID=402998 RepID=A0A9Q1LI57_9SOLA|nr:hypothetical protein K7X08_014233 [Anisodus acutangulus]
MARNVPNLKLKNVIVNSDNDTISDSEDEKNTAEKELDLPLEKLNLGRQKKLIVLNLGGLLVHRVRRRDRFNVQSYEPDLICGNFSGPKGDMQKFLDGLVDADDVPTYVKEHPLIGQPAITASHRDWDYYAKIIRFVGI